MIKLRKKNLIVIAVGIIFTMFLATLLVYSNGLYNVANADTSVGSNNITDICKDLTDDTDIHIGEETFSLSNYESYINDRFQIYNYDNRDESISDEWILGIVPIQLFEQKEYNFLYIGRKYGFYFNYNDEDDTYFVYLMLHEYDDKSVSGHIYRRIDPLYYEKYKFDKESGRVSLVYKVEKVTESVSGFTIINRYYQKYSSIKNVYLKNVAFNGKLYNLNSYNLGEKNYLAAQDNGGYFIGGSYKFKGVSTQSGKLDFAIDLFSIVLGNLGDKISDVIAVVDTLTAIANGAIDIYYDFREEITNEKNYPFTMKEIEREAQIKEHGHLLKYYASILNTPNTKNGILFGKNGSYIESTMYYKYANEDYKDNTGFVGRIKMDIVEENGNIIGSTVSPIATDVESNSYHSDIYNDKSIDVVEDETTDIYSLAGRANKLSFTAPKNGIYTFETFGSVENEFIEDEKHKFIDYSGNVTNKYDGLNQKLTVTLRKGQEFIFGSKNVSGSKGIYQIKAEFTPTEITLDNTKTLNIKAGESEFFTFNNIEGVGFNYSLNKTGEFTIKIALDDRFSVIDTALLNNKNTNAIALGAKGKYIIQITNNSAVDESVEFSLTQAKQVDLGEHSTSIGHRALYKIEPVRVSSLMKLQYQNLNGLKISLLDENFNIIIDKDDMFAGIFTLFEEGKTYYLLFENSNTYNLQVEWSISYSPNKVSLGQNYLTKEYKNMAYEISLPTDAQILLEVTDGITLSVFDSKWNDIEEQDSKYSLNSNERYFIIAMGDVRSFDLKIKLDSTDSLSGEIGECGYRFIEFSPSKSDVYEVNGIEDFEWYDNLLRSHSNMLYVGNKYYLKIYGDSNSAYDIKIMRKATSISLRSYLILDSGFYSVNIEDEDEYIVTVYNGNTKDVNFIMTDDKDNLVFSDVDASGKYDVHLKAGIYYIDIETSHKISLLIKKHNDQNVNINNVLDIDTQKIAFINANVDNYFVFTPNSTEEYWLNFSHTFITVKFSFAVMDINSIPVNFTVEQPNGEDNELYIIKMKLDEGMQYYINVKYTIDDTFSIPANLKIYKKKDTIHYAKLVPRNGGGDISILNNRLEVEDQVIYMGRTYEILAYNAEDKEISDFYWEVSGSSKVSALINENSFMVEYTDKSNSITLILRDNAGRLTVTLKLGNPFVLNAAIDKNKAALVTSIEHSNKNTGDRYDAHIEKMQLTISGSVYEIEGNEYSLLKAYEDGIDVFKNGAKIEHCNAYVRFDNGYCYTLSKSNIAIEFLKLGEIGDGAFPAEKEIIIDTRGFTASNRTFNVSSLTEKAFIFGSSSTTLNNVKFNFLKGDLESKEITLYLMNYRVNAVNCIVLDLNQIDVSNVYLIEDNKITGSSPNYLASANEITFYGDGTLEIIGDNGANGKNGANGAHNGDHGGDGYPGEDGENGVNGTGALRCSNLKSFCSRRILLIGGNGGNGGNGGRGGDGGFGGYGNKVAGGNGGRGGNGGDGGYEGRGCSISPSEGYFEIIHGEFGCSGDGGRGGDGGTGSFALIVDKDTLLSAYRGGNGGRGGDAGLCFDDHDCRSPKGGDGGNGGNGGNGVSWQDGKDYYYRVAANGGNGGNGGKGFYGGNGGTGGDGGDGAKGKNATLTSAAEDGKKGGNGGTGGNGGNSYITKDYAGRGGSGGIGGDGGDKKTVHKAGEKGGDGTPGDPGSAGGYEAYNVSGGDGGEGSCVALGTLITLADGRQVTVESLKGDEMLLVWNMYTGKFDVAPILFIDKDPAREYEVINLYFSDGTSVKVIDEHGFWDFNLNRYVFLRNDAHQYIGHWFNKQTVDEYGNLGYTKVQLTDVVVKREFTSAWSPVTYGHLCYYVNGMLSMPGATTGLVNIFDVNPDTMTVDEEAYNADVEKYGLFTYEEFAEICPIPEMIFEAFGGKYLKVAIGKGLTTFEELESLIARYSVFWESDN